MPERGVAELRPRSADGGSERWAPRAIAGFEVEGIQAFVENVEEDVPAVQQAAPPPILTLASLPSSRVRLTTLPPPQEKSAWLQEDGQSVTLKAEPEGEPLTRTKARFHRRNCSFTRTVRWRRCRWNGAVTPPP